MSYLNEDQQKKISSRSDQVNKENEEFDINKFNTLSNSVINEQHKSNYGFNEVLDIAKFNSKTKNFENESKDRKKYVDHLFDDSESMNQGINNNNQNINNIENQKEKIEDESVPAYGNIKNANSNDFNYEEDEEDDNNYGDYNQNLNEDIRKKKIVSDLFSDRESKEINYGEKFSFTNPATTELINNNINKDMKNPFSKSVDKNEDEIIFEEEKIDASNLTVNKIGPKESIEINNNKNNSKNFPNENHSLIPFNDKQDFQEEFAEEKIPIFDDIGAKGNFELENPINDNKTFDINDIKQEPKFSARKFEPEEINNYNEAEEKLDRAENYKINSQRISDENLNNNNLVGTKKGLDDTDFNLFGNEENEKGNTKISERVNNQNDEENRLDDINLQMDNSFFNLGLMESKKLSIDNENKSIKSDTNIIEENVNNDNEENFNKFDFNFEDNNKDNKNKAFNVDINEFEFNSNNGNKNEKESKDQNMDPFDFNDNKNKFDFDFTNNDNKNTNQINKNDTNLFKKRSSKSSNISSHRKSSNEKDFKFEIKGSNNNLNFNNANDKEKKEISQLDINKNLNNKNKNEIPEKENNNQANELMEKNKNVNFDNLMSELFQKSKDVNSVSVSEFNSNNNNNLPPDYIDLDNFKSEKIEEFNKKADEKKVEEKKENKNKANHLSDINNFEISNLEFDDLYIDNSEENLNGELFYDFQNFEESYKNQKTQIINKSEYQNKVENDLNFSYQKNLWKVPEKVLKPEKLIDNIFNEEIPYISFNEEIYLHMISYYNYDELGDKLSKRNLITKNKNFIENRIGYLTNFKTFKENYKLSSVKNLELKKFEEESNYLREVLSDGNGFFRAFMFSFIEVNIFSEDVTSLQYLRLDVYNILNVNKLSSINKLEIFGIFDLIILELERKEIFSAYNILINAYGLSENFDEVI